MFASCAAAEDPSLRGLPLVVAGDPGDRRSIVLTASYEARSFGVHTAMPVREALRLCPHVRIVPPDRALYERYSRRLFDVLRDFTPVVRPVSIDEAYLDLAGCPGLAAGPLQLASVIRRTVAERTGLSEHIVRARLADLKRRGDLMSMTTPHGAAGWWIVSQREEDA